MVYAYTRVGSLLGLVAGRAPGFERSGAGNPLAEPETPWRPHGFPGGFCLYTVALWFPPVDFPQGSSAKLTCFVGVFCDAEAVSVVGVGIREGWLLPRWARQQRRLKLRVVCAW